MAKHTPGNHIALGTGAFVINSGRYKGLRAVFIEPVPAPGPVGADASDSGLASDAIVDGATVITFPDSLSAAVLHEALAAAALLPDQEAKGAANIASTQITPQ